MEEERPVTPLGLMLRALWDLLVLNLLWLACSIPVITIGPASSAVYSVLLRRDRFGELPVVKNFFRSFLRDFLPALKVSVTGLILGLAAWVDIRFALTFSGAIKLIYLVVGCILAFGCLITLLVALVLEAYGENTFRGYLKNALFLVLGYPGYFALALLIWAVPVATVLLLPLEAVIRIGVLYLMWGFSGPAFLTSKLYNRVFDKVKEKNDA